jgi:hypothetical protein
MTEQRRYSLAEVGTITGLRRSSLQRYVSMGRLRAQRPRNAASNCPWFVSQEALDEFLATPRIIGKVSRLRNEKNQRALEQLLEGGVPVIQAMKRIGVVTDRFYRERKSNPAFAARMNAARAHGVAAAAGIGEVSSWRP